MDELNKLNETNTDETEIACHKKTLHFYNSMEEENEERYRYWAKLTSLEHLENVTQLIKQIFEETISEIKKRPLKISFSKN